VEADSALTEVEPANNKNNDKSVLNSSFETNALRNETLSQIKPCFVVLHRVSLDDYEGRRKRRKTSDSATLTKSPSKQNLASSENSSETGKDASSTDTKRPESVNSTGSRLSCNSATSGSINEQRVLPTRPTLRLVPIAKLLRHDVPPICSEKNIHVSVQPSVAPSSPKPCPTNSEQKESNSESIPKWARLESLMKPVSVTLTRLTPEEVRLMTGRRSSSKTGPNVKNFLCP